MDKTGGRPLQESAQYYTVSKRLAELEKIFAKSATDKGLISKIHKQLILLNIKTNKQTNKQSNQKMGRRSKKTFIQRRCTDGPKAHKTMFNIINYQRNVNQDYNEVAPHTGQNGICKKSTNITCQRG